MTIVVKTPAASSRLTTVQRLSDELTLPDGTAPDDEILGAFIDEASAFIERYTGFRFPQETIVEKLGSDGGHRLILSRRPIKSINSIKYKGILVDSSVYEIEDAMAGFVWRNDSKWINTTEISEGITSKFYGPKRKDYEVEYIAGFVLPDDVNRDLPYDIERACIELCKLYYYRQKADPMVRRERIGDSFVWYQDSGDRSLPPHIKAILDRWKDLSI